MKDKLPICVAFLLLSVVLNAQIINTITGTGTPGYNGDGIPATTAQIQYPCGVAVDAAGNVYVADWMNDRVRKITASTGIISTVAGTGISGFSGDGGPAAAAQLNRPGRVAVDAAGNIYIVDIGNIRIRKIDASTGIINTIAGTGVAGFSGDGGPATAAQLDSPQDVDIDAAGNVYIVDELNECIRKITLSTGIITTIAGTGTSGYNGDGIAATTAQLDNPEGVAVDAAGNVYIADEFNDRIRKITAGTGIISTIAGNGIQGFSGDGGPATAAQLNHPVALRLDACNMYIADFSGNRVRRINLVTGIISTVTGTGAASYNGDGIAATTASIYWPMAVALDVTGNVYIADYGNNRIRKITGLPNCNPMTVNSAGTTICAGACATINATPAGGTSPYSYSWNSGGQTTQSAVVCPTVTTVYTITITDGSNSTASSTVTVTVNPVYTSSQSASICAGTTYTLPGGMVVNTAGIYKDTLTSINGCDSIITTTLILNPIATSSRSVSICTGSTYNLPGGTVVSTGGIYKDTLVAANGCDSIITTTLAIVSVLTSNQSATICSGTTYILPGGSIVSTSGIYKDTLTSAGGCDSIITTTLMINPVSTFNQSASICSGTTYTLPAGTVVSVAGVYKDTLTSANGCDSIITTTLTIHPISVFNQPVGICSGSTYTLPTGTTVSAAGVYKDTLTSANGCDSIITTTLTVHPLPPVTVSPNVTIIQGATTVLSATGGGNYQWSSGEVAPSITVSPVQTTTYCVTVTDSNGCIAIACVLVTVEPVDCSKAGELYLPNAFSPNNDGENDYLEIYYGNIVCIKTFELTIYDRWGEEVYQSADLNFRWDGSHRKTREGTTVFVYYLDATLIGGGQIVKSGNVSLIQ